MTSIMQRAAALLPIWPLSRKKSGTPISAPPPKHRICRFVKLNMTLVFTAFKSLGTGTYANFHHLRQWAWNRLLARELVLNSVKHSSTVYPMHVHMAAETLLSTTMF
jgi:hypothetical protein